MVMMSISSTLRLGVRSKFGGRSQSSSLSFMSSSVVRRQPLTASLSTTVLTSTSPTSVSETNTAAATAAAIVRSQTRMLSAGLAPLTLAGRQQYFSSSTLSSSLTSSSSWMYCNKFTTSRHCWFSTTTTSGGSDDGGDDNSNNNSKNNNNNDGSGEDGISSRTSTTTTTSSPADMTTNTVSGTDQDISEPITTSPSSVSDDGEYSPADVMTTFQDTSYYHPIELPSELAARYSHMSNEELQDSSTIPGWDMLIHSPPTRGTLPKGALVGTVVSTKMMKTINVAVDRFKIHKKYKKRMRYTRKFFAHDEAEVAKDGDTVLIVPCQKLSKHKHFILRQIITPKGQL